jgi:membrane protein DedA with SNARE-associated domain
VATSPVVEVVLALLAGGIGLPIPEELALVTAGWFIARGEPAWPMCVAAILAVLAGDVLMYVAGRSARLGLVRRLIGERRILKLEAVCLRWGAKLLLVARFVPGLRSALLVAAGAGRVSFARFAVCDGIAALAGAGLWISLGHRLGPRLDEARALVADMRGVIGVAAVALALMALARSRRPSKSLDEPAVDDEVRAGDVGRARRGQ